MATILVVDDELGIRALLSEILTDEGHTVELAENAAQARLKRESMRPDLVLLDIWMPDVDGVTLLKEWSAGGQLSMPVVMMSGHGTIDTAVEATKFGASAFLEKPITLQKLLRAVEQSLVKPTPRGPAHAAPASVPLHGSYGGTLLPRSSGSGVGNSGSDLHHGGYDSVHHHPGDSLQPAGESASQGLRAHQSFERCLHGAAGGIGGMNHAPVGMTAFACQVVCQRVIDMLLTRERYPALDQPLN